MMSDYDLLTKITKYEDEINQTNKVLKRLSFLRWHTRLIRSKLSNESTLA